MSEMNQGHALSNEFQRRTPQWYLHQDHVLSTAAGTGTIYSLGVSSLVHFFNFRAKYSPCAPPFRLRAG